MYFPAIPTMAKRSASSCPTLSLLHLLGKKWTIPIVDLLCPSNRTRSLQFNQMQQLLVNITPKNLSRCLKELHGAKLVKKTETRINGVLCVGYSLTEQGLAFREFIRSSKVLGVSLYNLNPYCPNRQCNLCQAFNQ
jgi:DNA-binding HxlR family transcriptional regulator